MIFLIEYDRHSGIMRSLRTFPDEQRAVAEASRLELELSRRLVAAQLEIVLLEADTEDELRRTHRRYFETASELLNSATESRASSGR